METRMVYDKVLGCDVMEISLTEVHGGGLKSPGAEYHDIIDIRDSDTAVLMISEGLISGVEIGSWHNCPTTHRRWSPCGVIRKWGDEKDFVQIKLIDAFGQEGSGFYGDIWSHMATKRIRDIVDLSTIPRYGNLVMMLEKRGQTITDDFSRPKFRALI